MGRKLEEYIRQNYQKAIDRHEIQAYYQPVIRTSSRQLCSFEALARWIDPEHGVRELYPFIGEEWFESVKRAAMDGETVEGELVNTTDGKRFRFTARQIIYPGYCAITYQEL